MFQFLSSKPNSDFKLLISENFNNSKVVSGPLDGISFHRFKSVNIDLTIGSKRLMIPYSIGLLRYLLREKPDLLISEGRSNALNNCKCLLYSLLFRKPFYQWGLGGLRKTSFLSRISAFPFTLVERLSTGAIAYSSIGRDYYINIAMMKPENVQLAVNTIDDRGIPDPPLYSRSNDRCNFLYVGAIEPQKKPELLIKAYSLLLSRYMHSENSLAPSLSIVGSGSLLDTCKKLANQLGLTSNDLKFTGPLYGNQLKYYFDNSDLLVMPGLGGLVVSESICHGLPVLCAMGDGSEADWLQNGSGEISDFHDAESLSLAMQKYTENPEKLIMMRSKCRAARRAFSFENYVNVFSSLIDRHA